MANENLLAELNAFRVDRNLAPFADWRKARHMPLLEQYRAERAAFDAAYVAGGKVDDFEMSQDELAAQTLRPTEEEVADAAHATTEGPTENDASSIVDETTLKLDVMHAQVNNLTASTEEKSAEDALREAARASDFAGNKGVQNAAREIAKSKSYKQVAHYGKSGVDKPVGFIHQFLSDNPGMTRKEAVIALTEGYGINYSTARTQYQRWFTANKQTK